MEVVEKLEAQLNIPPGIRMHWTGCPNSCGQVNIIFLALSSALSSFPSAVPGLSLCALCTHTRDEGMTFGPCCVNITI